MILFTLFVLAFVTLTHQVCQGNVKIEGIQSGFAEFSGLSLGTSLGTVADQHVHNFDIQFNRAPQIGFGITQSNFDSGSASNFNLFRIQGKNITTTSVTFVFYHSNRLWSKIKIALLANTRFDLQIMTSDIVFEEINHFRHVKVMETNSIAGMTYNVGRAFINGLYINSTSTAIQAQVEVKNITAKQFQVEVMAGSKTFLKQMWFTIILLSPSALPFASYGFMIEQQNFNGIRYRDIQNTVQYPEYSLFGLARIDSGFQGDFSFSISNDLIVSMSNKLPNFIITMSFVLLGARTNETCSNCAAEQLMYYDQCYFDCPPGTFKYRYQSGGIACHKCSLSLKQTLALSGDGCVCLQGYQMADGVCVSAATTIPIRLPTNSNPTNPTNLTAPTNSTNPTAPTNITNISSPKNVVTPPNNLENDPAVIITDQKTCSLFPLASWTGKQCRCQTGYIFDDSEFRCIPRSNSTTVTAPITPSIPPKPASTTPPNPIIEKNSTNSTKPITVAPTKNSTVTIELPKNEQSCYKFPNTYWTGYNCACRVGYKYDLEKYYCVPIRFTPSPPTCGINAYYNGYLCVCQYGFYMDQNQNCVFNNCSANSTFVLNKCICKPGYSEIQGKCVQKGGCGQQSYINNGICICFQGYIKHPLTQICEQKRICEENQILNLDINVCECFEGLHRDPLTKKCIKCPNGQVWNLSQCIFVCGINQVYNPLTSKCQCKAGLGKGADNICRKCSAQTFLNNGYCVACPLNSEYVSGACICNAGFKLGTLSSGVKICEKICGINQLYDAATKRCRCRVGLGLIKPNQCGICPTNTFLNPNTDQCSSCGSNQYISGNQCVCSYGFGIVSVSPTVCAKCEGQGLHLMEGYCVSCPMNKIFINNYCACPDGTSQVNGKCESLCKPGQLTDLGNFCYICPYDQVIVNGRCECKIGYYKNPSGICEMQKCKANEYLINGKCGYCVLNTVYDPIRKICYCGQGYFLNKGGACERLPLEIINCTGNTFYNSTSRQCRICPAGCSKCVSENLCTSCYDSYLVPDGSKCVDRCGNGIKIYPEQCDDGNNINGDGCNADCTLPVYSNFCGNGRPNPLEQCDDNNTYNGDGCSSLCQIEKAYNCTPATASSPSVCTLIPIGMKLYRVPIINSKAVYITIKTQETFVFESDADERSFIRLKVLDKIQPSMTECATQSTDRTLFTCLLLFPQNAPKNNFFVELTFRKDNKIGQLSAEVMGSQNYFSTRSLSR